LDIAMKAWEKLTSEGAAVRLVSMPCWEWFDEQDQAYRDSVLPPGVTARVAVEAGIEQGWQKYLGPRGRFVGMSSFGASAPYGALYKHFGITPERVADAVKPWAAVNSRAGGSDGQRQDRLDRLNTATVFTVRLSITRTPSPRWRPARRHSSDAGVTRRKGTSPRLVFTVTAAS
jgi:hypothetical protein